MTSQTDVQAGSQMIWRPRYDPQRTYPVTVVEARSGNVLIEFESGNWNLAEYGELEEPYSLKRCAGCGEPLEGMESASESGVCVDCSH